MIEEETQREAETNRDRERVHKAPHTHSVAAHIHIHAVNDTTSPKNAGRVQSYRFPEVHFKRQG